MVEDRIRRRLGGFERLDRRALGKYAGRQPAAGWRLTIPTPEGDRRLDVVVPRQFPFALPRVAFVGPSMFLKWAHFERDSVLCLDGEGFDVERPGAVVADRIASACRLIGECERGERDGDFVDEFLSYWGQASNDESVPIYSLLPPNGPSRLVRVWRGKRFVLVADDDEAIAAWLKNRFGSVDIKTQSGALIWLDRPPLPAAFPNSGAAVRRLAAEGGFTDEQLCELVTQDASGATLLLGIDTPAGPALASTWVPHPTRHGRSTLGDGFRNKMVPAQIALGRYFGGSPIKRASVDRADASWIHGRGVNPRFDRFRRAKVAIIGCGSVGAAIAVLLAQSGIGRFVLFDPERLAWANVGRHPLGAPYVRTHKCIGLARKIRSDFPHVASVDAIARDIETVIMDEPDALADCDLVVSATGSWATEAFLDVWHVGSKLEGPVVYGWTEAHAAAGHAVAIAKNGRRFREGFDACGKPHLQVTEWSGPTTLREPACGAVFQPYGAVELSFTVGMIAEVVLRALDCPVTASTHGLWIGRSGPLRAAGGDWDPRWRSTVGFRDEGGFVTQLPWPDGSAAAMTAVEAAE
ncbi:ThiF family adenylyltransferase [Bradyrhizobium cosmicum]|uniref:ThiF family adenylyltransferase n=1 Tax=Bradyrhizobium cosmicum TaxID=1404864 RepID=UPI00143D44DA|nr:ThiF family adenylyltransferase [Bradyrhizobium cosmicum]